MPIEFFQQYQIKAEPPYQPTLAPGEAQFQSWHRPFSEPVRFLVNPRLRIALAASGLFSPVLNPETQLITFFESRWHYPWSEPKRFPKRLNAALNPFAGSFFDVTPAPNTLIQGWYQNFREPVWPKKGLKRHLQMVLAYEPRYLPPADVTITIAARSDETTDTSEFNIWAYTTPPVPADLTSVNVSIKEVDDTEANASIEELDT